MTLRGSSFASFSLCASIAILLLSGCSANFQTTSAVGDQNPAQTPVGVIQGSVHGGQAPVSGAKIYLFEVGTSGYGGQSKSLINSGSAGCSSGTSDAGGSFAGLTAACYVLTDANGNFALSGDYTCDAGRQVYMVGMSGNPGLGPNMTTTTGTFTATVSVSNGSKTMAVSNASGTIVVGLPVTGNGIPNGTTVAAVNGTRTSVTLSNKATASHNNETATFTTTTTTSTPANNPYIVQMAGLGQCPASKNLASQDPFVNLNEISTVVFAYTMAPFGSDAFDIGTDAGGTTAIQYAMANAMNIFNLATGTLYSTTNTAGSSGTIPTDKIYYLADILAQCVNNNSSNSLASGYCRTLFNGTNQTINNNTSTSDEAQAIFYIAHNPTTNVQTLYNLVPSQQVFTSSLAQPADWALPIVYKNAVSTQPGNIAFDSTGNAWISDQSSSAGGVVKVTPTGVVTKFTNLNNGSANGSIYQLAVDPGDVVWALDYSGGQIYRLNTSGWVSTVTGTGNNTLSHPVSIAFNTFGNAQVLNASSGFISMFNASGIGQTAASYNQSGNDGFGSLGAPTAITVDAGTNAYIPESVGCQCIGVLTNGSTNTLAYDDYSTTLPSGGAIPAITVDGSNNPWHVQPSNNEIVEDPTASGYLDVTDGGIFGFGSLRGYYFNVQSFFGVAFPKNPTTATGGGLNAPVSLAFDGGGNLWAANSGTTTVSGFTPSTQASLESTTGIQTGGSSGGALGAAPDLAGDLWTVNSDGSVSEILGLATPTAGPVYPSHISKKP